MKPVYTNNALSFFFQPEGYVVPNGSSYDYVFQYKDNLGSNRLSYSDYNGDGTISLSEVVEEDNYYPFGLKQTGYNNTVNGTRSNYKYNGKELQDDAVGSSALDWYDYGARFYDAGLGRWFVPDPLAEKAPSWSPYRYGFNNPISYTDPTGMFEDWVERNGKVIWDKNVTSTNDADLKKGDRYIGQTVNGTTENGDFIYGDQYGQLHNLAPLPEITVKGTMTDYARTVMVGNKLGIYQAQQDFLENPVTQATFNTLLFVATGGIEGLMSLGSLGRELLTRGVARTGTTVLGHYPEYVNLAESIGARRFQIPTNVWNKMSAAEQWTANTKFLDRMILRGDKIRLATPLNQVKPGSFFQKELNYLFEKGYKISSDGLMLIK